MEYISARGIKYKNEIPTIRKKNDILQPIYEAFTNAWEAILTKYTIAYLNLGKIEIGFFVTDNPINQGVDKAEDKIYEFAKISVKDNGIGLTDECYRRLTDLRDDSKNFSNKGTGRVQFIHFFDKTEIESIYNEEHETKRRKVSLSKNDAFLGRNAILRLDVEEIVEAAESETIVTFTLPLDKKDQLYYTHITAREIQQAFVRHFLSRFCDNRDSLPQISIKRYIGDNLIEDLSISQQDTPTADREEQFTVRYSKLDGRKVVQTDNTEDFKLRSFVQPKDILAENGIYLVSKGEIASNIPLDCLQKTEAIDGKRYMFLLSGKYIDENDGDDRGNIRLISQKEFKKREEGLFPEEVILLDDIQEETNKTIGRLYQEIANGNNEKLRKIEDLQRMFLLNPETVESLKSKIKTTATDEDILQAIYKSDADIKAKQDAEIKQQITEIEALVPTDDDYQEKLKEKVNDFVRTIPLQNRTALSQYVARRRLVLEIFDKILNRELENLRKEGRIDEDILHNLIFQQSSEDAESSDLWLINEEYIYFKGVSEHRLVDIEYNGKKIFDKEFSDEDKRYLNSGKERRLTKRPDILLFPEEGKCIIIEFKAPDVNVSEHLTQIDFYASLLRNYTIDELQLTTFYGYLIGQNIEDRDVRGRVSRFEYSPRFNYWFRPSEKVIDFNRGNDGNIYTEIIKYSSLLDRAKLRNKIFIDKLEKGNQ